MSSGICLGFFVVLIARVDFSDRCDERESFLMSHIAGTRVHAGGIAAALSARLEAHGEVDAGGAGGTHPPIA